MLRRRPISLRWLTSTAIVAALLAGIAHAQERLGISQQALTSAGPADRDTRPSVAFLTLHGKNGGTMNCSGTLISPTVILTAAHCIVCTQSVTARIYGDVGFFESPQPGKAPQRTHPSASLAFNPAAYPELPNCVDPDSENVFADINRTTQWGRMSPSFIPLSP